MKVYDVIIVGGGPAGLNAAVVLGRCRRNVLLFDKGTQRNLSSDGLRNYLTRDDISATGFLEIGIQGNCKIWRNCQACGNFTREKMQTGLFLVKDEKDESYYS